MRSVFMNELICASRKGTRFGKSWRYLKTCHIGWDIRVCAMGTHWGEAGRESKGEAGT